MTLPAIRTAVAAILDEASAAPADDDDLLRFGLDSLRVMTLAGLFRRYGVRLGFAEMLERPTIAAWWALASARLRDAPAQDAADPPAAGDDDAPFDLSCMQHAYWIGRREGHELGVGCHYYFEFDGDGVDPRKLDAALAVLVQRHGMLRVRFDDDGRQRIARDAAWHGVTVHDVRAASADAVRQHLDALRARESNRRLDAERGEVLDVQLTLLPGARTRMHVNIDMLTADALSFRIVLSELAALYEQPD
ncbi:MAG: condensation domain-containing protein, partial [Candidatus Eremiobacteraeota bacterium]|nr:condensation domain-containing protein [Candidatus Eremiobacteraeota bacterium]